MQHSFSLPLNSWEEKLRPCRAFFSFFDRVLRSEQSSWGGFWHLHEVFVCFLVVLGFFSLFLGAASSHNGKYLLFCNSFSAWTSNKINPQIQSLWFFYPLSYLCRWWIYFWQGWWDEKKIERMRIILSWVKPTSGAHLVQPLLGVHPPRWCCPEPCLNISKDGDSRGFLGNFFQC